MKNKRLLAGPYLFWSVSFVVIPLLVIVAVSFFHSSVIFEYGNLLDSGISAGNDPEPETGKPDKFYCAGLYSANVDELSSPYTGMADIA